MTGVPAVVYGFRESADAACRLAEAMELPFQEVAIHHFPDGESLVRVDDAAETGIVYRSLDHPNDKLVELMLTASVLREAKTWRLVLVAPYLCYMRQDTTFRRGEAVSQRVIGRFLAGLFDFVVTVDPHLHRTRGISEVFSTTKAVSLSAAPLVAEAVRAAGVTRDTMVVGPDGESRQWVEAVAEPLGLEILLGVKSRRGDREVRIEIPGIERVKDRPVILVDDLVSTGKTLIECAWQLCAAGATSLEVFAVHALFGPKEEAALHAAGIARVRSTDAVPHSSNAVQLAPLLGEAARELLR